MVQRAERKGGAGAGLLHERGANGGPPDGAQNLQNDWVKWNTGYRLPTEAEWEKAARGGVSGHRFPWADTDDIMHSRANYWGYPFGYDRSYSYHPAFYDGVLPYTSPAGYFAANGYGLYDMAGNVLEWCWDWYGSTYYGSSPGNDPRGPATGSFRVFRGGNFAASGRNCRTADRLSIEPSYYGDGTGARTVLPADQP